MDAEIIKRITRLEQEIDRLKGYETNFSSLSFRVNDGVVFPLPATQNVALRTGRPDATSNIYVTKVTLTGVVATTFDGTNRWQITLGVQDNNATNTFIVSNQDLWIAGRSAGKRFTHEVTVNTLYTPTTGQEWFITLVKAGTPGTLDVDGAVLWYAFA